MYIQCHEELLLPVLHIKNNRKTYSITLRAILLSIFRRGWGIRAEEHCIAAHVEGGKKKSNIFYYPAYMRIVRKEADSCERSYGEL